MTVQPHFSDYTCWDGSEMKIDLIVYYTLSFGRFCRTDEINIVVVTISMVIVFCAKYDN
jgi:hypothetical protein